MSVISQCIKDKRVEAYEKVLDESPTTQDQSFKIEGLALAREAVPKVKKKPLQQNLMYEPPHKKEKGSDKVYGWMCSNGSVKLLGTMLSIQFRRKHTLD